MIQKLKKIQYIVAGLFMLSACELDLVPQADLSDGVFWQTDQDFRQATNYLYKISETENRTETNMMLHPQFRDVMSDNAVSGGYLRSQSDQ
ncbi:MAG: hypothetical protein AB2L24_25440 [Mangrovibacterium sp.]